MKKSIKDFALTGKRVIIRCDLNVPLHDGIITDNNRILESLPTIKYAKEQGAKIILMSHLGRIKDIKDKELYSLAPVALELSKLLCVDVIFIPETHGDKLEQAIAKLKNGDVLLMENTRFEDLNGKLESSNDFKLGKYWSSLGDVFINDAFGTCHRSHASNVGIASNLPNGIGFLMEKELKYLMDVIDNPKRPLTVILGGAKVVDKINVIENLVNKADYILVGGAMAYTFLRSTGLPVGKSLIDEDSIDFCRNMVNTYADKIILPIDGIYAKNIDGVGIKECFLSDVKDDDIGYDIGPGTIKLFKQYIDESNTIIWNGPLGMFENTKFANGTEKIMQLLANTDKTTIIGGGDTTSAVNRYGLKDKFTHVSTGGGASLELLEGKILPGVGVIDDK